MTKTVTADIDRDEGKIRIIKPSFLYNTVFKNIPGMKFDSKSKSDWVAPLSWSSALALRATLGEQLEFTEELTEYLTTLRSQVIDPAFDLREETEYDLEDPNFDFLRGYQKAGVKFLSTVKTAILADGMGSGKAICNSERVLTPTGYVTMSEISMGDFVVGSDGKPTEVIGVYPQGVRSIYKVSFNDGASVYVDGDHLWSVATGGDIYRGYGFYKTLTTNQIVDRGVNEANGNARYNIPVTKPVEFSRSEELPVPPYTLGAILGDGSIGPSTKSVGFTTVDHEILDEMSQEGIQSSAHTHPQSFSLSYQKPGTLQRLLKEVGVWGYKSPDKRIPEEYLYSSVSDRLSLLQGLMDTDGGISGEIAYFYTSSEDLAEGVVSLVNSLGGITRVVRKDIPKGGNYRPISVHVSLPREFNPFRLARKADQYRPASKYVPARRICGIEYSHEEEATCIKVAAKDSLFIINNYVVTHNTYTAGATLRYLHEVKEEETLPALVVCPNSTKRSWKKDMEKIWPGKTIEVVSGTATKRRKILESGADIYIMNWEALKGHSRLAPYGSIALKKCPECGGKDESVKPTSCHVHEKELNRIPFKAIIGDEIHRIKDGKSQVSRALKGVAKSSGAEIRFGLSGTPIGNNYDDLWSPLNFILPESYPSKTKFIDYYLDTSYDLWGGLDVIGLKSTKEDEFFLGIDPYLRRMPKDLILDQLPEKIFETRHVEMTAKQKKAYEQMSENMVAELDGGVTIATTPLVKMSRLLQLSSAFGEVSQEEVLDKETGEIRTKDVVLLSDPSCKLDAFMEDLPDFEGESVAVFASSKQLINLLSARMTKKEIPHGLVTGDQDEDERQYYMDLFQEGRIQFILLTTGAGGTGITLTEGSTAVFLQRPWSMIESKQAEDRVHRIGSEKHDRIRYIDYVTEGTVDEVVIPALQTKDTRLEKVLRDKDLMRRVLTGGDLED